MLLTWKGDDVIVDRTALFRATVVDLLSLGWLRVWVKARVALAVERVPTEFYDLRFDTADDVETLEFENDEDDVSDTVDRW
jgi:hypothetical protein